MLSKKNILLSMVLFLLKNMYASSIDRNQINFGSKNSAVVVKNGAKLSIKIPQDGSRGVYEPSHPMLIDTGSLVNEGVGIISGTNIRFKSGIYSFFNSVANLTGELDPNINRINLGDNHISDGDTMIANPGGLAQVKMQILSGNNILRGQPLFFGTNDLVFKDSSSLLAIAIQNTLNTNISLNGGVLFLQDDLRLGDDAVILDSGRVVFNNRRLLLGGQQSNWNGDVLWDGSRDLQINSLVILNGIWAFLGNGQINGNGNVLDLSGGGSIVVLPNSNLRLAGLHIKGLGPGTIKIDDSSQLTLSDVVIEMDTDYVIDSGTVYVEGSSTVITKDHILTFTDGNGTVGRLTVDRVALTYDTLASLDNLNIRPALIQDPGRRHITIIGNGDIRTIRGDTITFHSYRSQGLLLKYAIVAPYRKFQIFPEILEDGSSNFDVVIDGNTNFLGFTITDEQVFIVTENVQAITQNIFMRDLSPKHILLERGSSLVFGDQTTISFSRNDKLDYPWIFQGSTILKGSGNTLELGPNGSIEVIGENSVLLLDGITFKGLTGNQIRCLKESSKIILKNVKWFQADDVYYDIGGLDILDSVTMTGPYNFIFSSSQSLNILANSTLSLIRDMIFTYAPISGNRYLFRCFDKSSTFFIDQATFSAPAPGVVFEHGRFVVRSRNFLKNDGALSASEGIIFSSNLTIDRPSGASLELLSGFNS